jgi:predicted RNase H-like HicB family nuclease
MNSMIEEVTSYVKKRARLILLPMTHSTFPVVIEVDSDGYFVSCPSLQGCYSQGDTYEEAITNIEDAIRLHVEDRLLTSD